MSISNKDHLRISIVNLIINGDPHLLVPAKGDLFMDESQESLPSKWKVIRGKDGSAILEIKK